MGSLGPLHSQTLRILRNVKVRCQGWYPVIQGPEGFFRVFHRSWAGWTPNLQEFQGCRFVTPKTLDGTKLDLYTLLVTPGFGGFDSRPHLPPCIFDPPPRWWVTKWCWVVCQIFVWVGKSPTHFVWKKCDSSWYCWNKQLYIYIYKMCWFWYNDPSTYPHVRYPHEKQSLNRGLLTITVPLLRPWWYCVFVFHLLHLDPFQNPGKIQTPRLHLKISEQ